MDANLDCYQKIGSYFGPPQLKSWLPSIEMLATFIS